MTDNNKFWYHYNLWKKEIEFLSTGVLDNEHFKAMCNLDECSLIDTLKSIKEILDEKDDFVVDALDIILTKHLGRPVITSKGYVTLHDYCNAWRTILEMIFEGYTDIDIGGEE